MPSCAYQQVSRDTRADLEPRRLAFDLGDAARESGARRVAPRRCSPDGWRWRTSMVTSAPARSRPADGVGQAGDLLVEILVGVEAAIDREPAPNPARR